MTFPVLPPYTIEPTDQDLWQCGRRLSGEGAIPSTPNSYEVYDLVMSALHAYGAGGVSTKGELAVRAGVTLNQVTTALTNAGVLWRDRRYVHPAFAPRRALRPQRVFAW